jgi:ATP-binding cassette subfamily C protein
MNGPVTRRGLRAYFPELVRFAPGRFAVACALNLASALLSGVSLLALLPLLHFTGWLPDGSHGGLVGSVLSRLPAPEGRPPLYVALGLFVALVSGATLLDYARQGVTARLRLDFLFELRRRLNAAFARARWSHLLTRRLQHAHHMITTGVVQIAALTQYALQLVSETLLTLAYLAFSLALSWRLTLLTGAVAAVLLALHRAAGAATWGSRHFAATRRLQDKLAQFLDGIKPAKSLNLAGEYARNFDAVLREERAQQWGFARAQSRARASLAILSTLTFAAAFLIGAVFLRLPLATFALLLVLYARLLPRASAMQQAFMQAANLAPVYAEMRAMLAEYEAHPDPAGTGRPLVLESAIRLEGVRYAHPGGAGILGVTAVLPANSTTAIVGPSGSGKTTLADLLTALLSPQEGAVYVDDELLTPERGVDWRAQVGYVPQDPFLFHGTVRENLAWGGGEAPSEAEMWDALRAAAAEGFARALPEGLDTAIGDKGNRLSGGERQRLVLARALLRKPRVLLLDEATSALDVANEDLIYAALRNLRGTMTLVFITHRPETLRLADQVLRLEAGRLVPA